MSDHPGTITAMMDASRQWDEDAGERRHMARRAAEVAELLECATADTAKASLERVEELWIDVGWWLGHAQALAARLP